MGYRPGGAGRKTAAHTYEPSRNGMRTSVVLMMPRMLRRNSLRVAAASHSVRGVLAVKTPGVAFSVSRMRRTVGSLAKSKAPPWLMGIGGGVKLIGAGADGSC